MPPERTLPCHGLAVMTGLLTYPGSLVLHGVATGDPAAALHPEALDVGSHRSFGLPVCDLVAGLLGYLGPARTWRWSLDMLATPAVCTLIFAGSRLSLGCWRWRSHLRRRYPAC